jgi:putative N-acetyltransferase (TIGR04045 family)
MFGDEQPANRPAGTDRTDDAVTLAPLQQNTGATAAIVCLEARDDEQRAQHHRIRRAVFVDEQAIFVATDVDEHDGRDDVVRVLALHGDQPVGAVRLYPLDAETGLWKGDRLAVLSGHRTCGAGAPLVRFAVAYAGAHGGRRMVAHVQAANVRFFERLGWSSYRAAEDYLGRIHQPMHIPLGGR